MDCPLCNQKHTRDFFNNYEMTMEEVQHIVDSIKRRNIHIDVIELTGGEPSLWSNLENGVALFKQICDTVTLITNGNNPQRIIDLKLKYWVVSSSQASEQELEMYKPYSDRIIYNNHHHKKIPETSVKGFETAACSMEVDPFGNAQIALMYIKGYVYYCCSAFGLSNKVPLTRDVIISFERDWLEYFKDRVSKPICGHCLSNTVVWHNID
jgi:hypothetical protein